MVKLFTLPAAAAIISSVTAQSLQVGNRDEIINSSSLLAEDLMALYQPNRYGMTPGILPGDEYEWWTGANFMASFIDYWRLTGDDAYNDIVMAGLLHQSGEEEDYNPRNVSLEMSNDDQCLWAISAMLAAENQFPDPPEDEPQWLRLAQNVFDEMLLRHSFEVEEGVCNGGLRWQTFPGNAGFDFKSVTSNACFLDLGARLGRYTGNATFTDTAVEIWDWLSEVGLVTDDWEVLFGLRVDEGCEVDSLELSYDAALLAHGAAVMYNYTDGSSEWRERVSGLVDHALETFFPDGIAVEQLCEPDFACDDDEVQYKGLTHRWLSSVTQLAPFTAEIILPVLRQSAEAAVEQCTGGDSGRECGFFWAEGEFQEPDSSGVGEQINVLTAVTNLLISDGDDSDNSGSGGNDSNGTDGDDQGTPTNDSDGPSNTDGSNEPEGTPDASGHLTMELSVMVILAGVTTGLVYLF